MVTRVLLLILVTLGVFVTTVATAQRAEKATTEANQRAGTATVTSSDSAKIKPARTQLALNPAMVPEGKTYYLMKNGKVDKKFKSGSSTPMVADCAQIKCPKTFDKDIVCWKCVER